MAIFVYIQELMDGMKEHQKGYCMKYQYFMILTLFLPQASPHPQVAEFITTQEGERDVQTENMLEKSRYLMSRGQREL